MANDTATDPQPASGPKPLYAEFAPSRVQDEFSVTRTIGMAGVGALIVGTAIVFFNSLYPRWVPTSVGYVALAGGMVALLFQAVREADVVLRRWFAVFGLLLTASGAVCLVLALTDRLPASLHWLWFAGLIVGLGFTLAAGSHETDAGYRRLILYVLGIAGAALTLVGLLGSLLAVDVKFIGFSFLLYPGIWLALIGLVYLWGLTQLLGAESDLGCRLGWTLVAIGTVAIGYAIIRSLVPLLYPLGWIAEPIKGYFVPSGLLVIAVGLVYVAIGLGFSSDHPLVVLTRRELASYFYSPIAYLVLFGLTMIGWANHYVFIQRLLETIGPSPFGGGGRAMLEPIVGRLIIDLIPVFAVIFVVPAITMRSLSEEQRTGTLEVMLTVALSEYMIVLSKFIASFVFFMLLWVPWAMFLVSLRIEGGTDFDYRPILGFVLALAASGAGFVSMGIFFSSLTRNQIIAAVLCFMGMLAHLVCFLVANAVSNNPGDSFAASILRSLSFISIWQDSITGKVPIKDLLLHLSFCVFWLYLTVKVLEARRWR